jgi:hypothetical protein
MDSGRVRRHLSGTRVFRATGEVGSSFKGSAEVTSDVTTGVVVEAAASGTGSIVDDLNLEMTPEVKLLMMDVVVVATGAMKFQ